MFRNNPEAIASIRAPLIENKVTDFILALAKMTDKKVSREELYRERRRRKGGLSENAAAVYLSETLAAISAAAPC